MAKIALEDWKEKVRDPKIECMSRDEMSALQSERLVKQVKNVYDHVEFYTEGRWMIWAWSWRYQGH